MRVFLIHGMGRSRASMLLLSRRLSRAGHATSTFGYLVSQKPLDEIARRFVEHVEAGARGEPYAVVGHSLGNVITRLGSPRLPAGFSRFVMLAPPNHPPLLARRLQTNPIFRALTRDAGRRLLDDGFYRDLPVPRVPMLIFAGTGGPRARWLPFAGAPSDGVVGVEETRLPGVPHRVVPCLHTFIMNDKVVTRDLVRFLEHAHLDDLAAAAPGGGAG